MKIIKMKYEHYDEVLTMMKTFYHSDAVWSNGSDDIFHNDIMQCINDNPYVEGYVFIDQEVMGYAMIAKSFSTEFSKQCLWIEDLYIKEEYRNQGIGSKFMSFITHQYQDCIFRLEVEEENINAIKTYKKNGFIFLPYKEMIKID